MDRKFAFGAILKGGNLTDRQIHVVASDATVDRVGDIMVPGGCRLDRFRDNPIVLANHDPEKPIGTAQVSVGNSRVEALIEFAPPRISAIADEWCGLAKAGILNAVSIGFNPIDSEPIRNGGRRFTEWELLELSVVSVPANPSALVIERSSMGADRSAPAGRTTSFNLSKRERQEREFRMATRAEGLVSPDHETWLAWLRSEYCEDDSDALRSHVDHVAKLNNHQRFMLRKKCSDFTRIYTARASVRASIDENLGRGARDRAGSLH